MTHAHSWHAGSLFSAGPRRPFTREQRRIWDARLELHRRARAITATHRDVGKALLARLGEDGRLDPSHATLAHDAGCCERTVREALRRLNRLGLVSWLRRLIRTREGTRQTSNAYALGFGDVPTVQRCAGRTCRGTPPSMIPLPYPPPQAMPLLDRAAALDALAAVARQRGEVLMGRATHG